MLKILFIGDINGKIGRKAIKKILPGLKKSLSPDLIIANADNIAHGDGISVSTAKELLSAGVNWLTNGDHVFNKKKQALVCFEKKLPILRPANFPPHNPGIGYSVITARRHKILLVNLIGRVFMRYHYDCPFRTINEILGNLDLSKQKLSAIIIDMHAEATSEKIALAHFLDGRVSAVLGTHTHIMTADHKITDKKTAYMTDVGMVGAADECIGVDKDNIIKTFLAQIKYPHVIPEKGRAIFNAALININTGSSRAQSIKPITKFVNIN